MYPIAQIAAYTALAYTVPKIGAYLTTSPSQDDKIKLVWLQNVRTHLASWHEIIVKKVFCGERNWELYGGIAADNLWISVLFMTIILYGLGVRQFIFYRDIKQFVTLILGLSCLSPVSYILRDIISSKFPALKPYILSREGYKKLET